MTVDWDDYRKCPVCFAEIGRPCRRVAAVVAGGTSLYATEVERERPHSRRQLRKGRGR